MTSVIPPRPEPDDAYFWDGVAEHQLLLQRCADCGELRHPPGPMCGNCHSTEWDTQPATGRAQLHAWIQSQHPTQRDAAPRVVALVDLEEGVRFLSNLSGAELPDIANGMAVELFFAEVDGVLLPQFRPSGST